MKKILLIGNSGIDHGGTDGQTVKVRLYLKKIKDEGFDCDFVDLEHFSKHPFSILLQIKRKMRDCDRIVLITAQRGSKLLIPFINHCNKKFKKPFVFPLIGTSVLHYTIDKLNDSDKNSFILNHDFSKSKNSKKWSKHLQKMTYVLPETDLLTDVFSEFYKLNNVKTLNNFRDDFKIQKTDVRSENESLKIVYLSRVMREKGIFDLLDVVEKINCFKKSISLDIYGECLMNDDDLKTFNLKTNSGSIKYGGRVKQEDVVETLSKYDLFVFPTRFVGEGVPGVIVESLLAGTPVLTSNFPQAHLLLTDNKDSIFFEMFNKDDLEQKLLNIINNMSIISKLKENALESSKKYTYEHERKKFLKYVCGVEDIK